MAKRFQLFVCRLRYSTHWVGDGFVVSEHHDSDGVTV
jgi:hypothetical protein